MALPNKAKIPVGTLLAAKYRVTCEIGRGGMAAVYEAENVDIGKRVAIKVLAQELTTSAVVVERFLREARAAAAIRSPYICDVYDSGKLPDGRPFLVLELLEGESLYERMTKVRWIDVDATLTIMFQICRGLTKAHAAQIVHRDLKPENIFLTKDEEGRLLAKILDFGLAKFYAPVDGDQQQARLTREGAVFGTPAYMSPEQVRGQGAVDHRADLWALGCIVYECLTGRTVWSTDQGVAMTFAQIASAPTPRPSLYRPDLPPSFTTWFDKALHRDITRRFQNAKEFAEELAAALQKPVHGEPLPSLPSRPSSMVVTHALDTTANPPVDLGSLDIVENAAPASPRFNAPPVPPPPPHAPQPSTHSFATPHGRDLAAASGRSGQRAAGPFSRAVVLGTAVIAVGSGAYAGISRLFTKSPPVSPQTTTTTTAAPATAQPITSASVAAKAPAPTPERALLPWVQKVRDAQEAIGAGDPAGALKLLKEAAEKGRHGMPHAMMEHLQVAMSNGDAAPCRVTGLARPRSYDLASPGVRPGNASRPAIVAGPHGPVITWTDGHEGPEHAYTVALDGALRNKVDPVDVTPEGMWIGRPGLTRTGDRLVLDYWDAKGPQAGVYVRFLDGHGRIAGGMVGVTQGRSGSYWPSLAPAPDGGFFVAWSDERDTGSEDIFLRRLGPELDLRSDVVRATDLMSGSPGKPRARLPSLSLVRGALHLAYRVERGPTHAVHHLRALVGDVAQGLQPAEKGAPRADRVIGEAAHVNNDRSKADMPELACGEPGCFLVWHGEDGAGASAAFIDPIEPEPLWRKRFSHAGGHPAVAFAPSGQAQLVWFEAGKVVTAAITRDGVGPVTRVAKVSGEQPTPSIAPGDAPGEWYLAWLDYETGHLEAYAARVVCK